MVAVVAIALKKCKPASLDLPIDLQPVGACVVVGIFVDSVEKGGEVVGLFVDSVGEGDGRPSTQAHSSGGL